MKIFWMVNIECPPLSKACGRGGQNSGPWIVTLAKELSGRTDLELVIAHASPLYKCRTAIEDNGITYLGIPRRGGRRTGVASQADIDCMAMEVAACKPDVIHVFGSEFSYGLSAAQTGIPTVLRIQGILNAYLKVYFADLSIPDIIRFPEMLLHRWYFASRRKQELKVFSVIKNYEGQSLWDKAWVEYFAPDASYTRNAPILRSPFMEPVWNSGCMEKFRLISFSNIAPYKGLKTLLLALSILKKTIPEISLTLIGSMPHRGAGAYYHHLIKKLNLNDLVNIVPTCTAEKIAGHFAGSHLFVNPSFIENESLGRLEAMAAGVPTLCSYAGGMPNTSDEAMPGHFFPAGDHVQLAAYAVRILLNDVLASRLSSEGIDYIRTHHDPEKIAAKTMAMYRECIAAEAK